MDIRCYACPAFDEIEYQEGGYGCQAEECLICPECGEPRPYDERVKAGMKCYYCAYPYPE